MTVDQLLGIFIGIVFFFAGIGGFYFSKEKKWLSIIFFLTGSWTFYIYTIGPLSNSKQKLDAIINIDSRNVEEIIIKPTTQNYQDIKTLVNKEFKITNRNSIENICQVLNKTEHASSGYLKDADSLSQIEIKMYSDTIKFGIRKSGNKTGLNVYSRGEYGWNYGTLKCENLWNTIENIINK